MPVRVLSEFTFGDMQAMFLLDGAIGRVGLWLLPAAMKPDLQRLSLDRAETEIPVEHGQQRWAIDPLVHIQRSGDVYPDAFSQGRTLRNGASTRALRYQSQQVEESADGRTITTILVTEDGLTAQHQLSWRADEQVLRANTRLINRSDKPVTLELLTSFSLGGITPFACHRRPPSRLAGEVPGHRRRLVPRPR